MSDYPNLDIGDDEPGDPDMVEPKAMSNSLTREQLVALLHRPVLNGTELRDVYAVIMTTDAAQRAQIEVQAKECHEKQAQLDTCHGIITAQETTIVIMESTQAKDKATIEAQRQRIEEMTRVNTLWSDKEKALRDRLAEAQITAGLTNDRVADLTAKLETSRNAIHTKEREHLEACAELDEVTAKLAVMTQQYHEAADERSRIIESDKLYKFVARERDLLEQQLADMTQERDRLKVEIEAWRLKVQKVLTP